jgi:hypothetical protein
MTEKTFHFAKYAQHHFNNGNMKTKRNIFAALGQNFTLKDGKLLIELNEWFIFLKNSPQKNTSRKYSRNQGNPLLMKVSTIKYGKFTLAAHRGSYRNFFYGE